MIVTSALTVGEANLARGADGSGLMVSPLASGSSGPGSNMHYVLGKELSQCLCSPLCINGYRRI